jgi:hypothetical protein
MTRTTHTRGTRHDQRHDTRHKSAHGMVWAERSSVSAWMCEDEFGEVEPGLPFGEAHDVELLRDLDGDGLLLVAHHERVRLITRLPASHHTRTQSHTVAHSRTRSDKHSSASPVGASNRSSRACSSSM